MAITGPQDEGLDGATVTRDPLIGVLLGEYRVLSRLGEGAMGVVYRGEQQLLGKPVAIKVLKTDHSDPTNVQRLLEEARAVTAARHPNIIDIFSFGQAPTGQQYFVMECLEGEPLDVWVQHVGKVKLEDALTILQQVVLGLGAAHTAGVIHRDLKPGNIFYARLHDGTRFVKLLDFGLAKRAAPNAGVRGTSIVGTPLYMAPEQATHGELGPWTDLYALGCIAYELISGVPPFAGANVIATLELHATHVPKRLTALDPSVPPELDALVFELLEKSADRRPKSAAVVKRALDRIARQASTARTRGTGVQALSGAQAPTQLHLPPQGPVPREGDRAAPTTQLELRRLGPPLLAGTVVALLGVLAVVAWSARSAADPVSAPPPPTAPLPIPTAIPAPAPAPAPAPVSEPEPAVAEQPPRPKPRPTAVRPAHSAADVERRLARLRDRIRGKSESAARAMMPDVDEFTTELKAGVPPDEIWRELDRYEKDHF